jgi:hypothetical protein
MKLKRVGASSTEVQLNPDTLVLFSYETPVACHITGKGFMRTAAFHSRTTSKHIGQFVARHGGRKENVTEKPQAYFDSLTSGAQ